MTPTLTTERVRRLRCRAQGLGPAGLEPAGDAGLLPVLRRLVALQDQDAASAGLALRARCAGLVEGDVRDALDRGETLRTWCLRGTLHLLASADAGWLVALLGPGAMARSRARRAELGLTGATLERGRRVVLRALAGGGAATRTELTERLAAAGVSVEGQGPYHLLRQLALEGRLGVGPDRDGEATFRRRSVDDAAGVSREDALGELARRYLLGYGPAGIEDFVAWSGLDRRDAATAWRRVEAESVAVEVEGRPARLAEARLAGLEPDDRDAPPQVHLLPGFDAYLLGYRDRAFAVPTEHARRQHPGGGVLRPVVVVDGRVLATWGRARRGGRVEVRVAPFAPLPEAVAPGLEREVADLGRFLGTEARLRLEPPA